MQLLYSFVICGLACITVSTAVEDCPVNEDISPCTCEIGFSVTTITCRSLSTVDELRKLSTAIKGSKEFRVVLWKSNISNVPKDIFQGTNIVQLYVESSEILTTGTSEEPDLIGLENSLQNLKIWGSYSSKDRPMAPLSLSHLKKLRELSLEYNYIPKLGNDWFEKGPLGLKALTLYHNGIVELGDKAFANFKELEDFGLSSERMRSTVSRSMLPKPATNLVRLHLENLGLTTLPDDIFSDMPKLEYVMLYENDITTISESVWSPIWQHLQYIDLYMNPLECDSKIKWMYYGEEQPRVQITGTCQKPEKLKGKYFEILRLSDFE